MKKMMVVGLLFISLAVTAQNNQRSLESLTGSWRNKNGFGLDVLDSTTIYIVHGSQRKLATASKVDFSKTPVGLELIIKDSSKLTHLKSMLVFINDNTVQWQLYDADIKPVGLRSDMRNTLFLKRVQVLTN